MNLKHYVNRIFLLASLATIVVMVVAYFLFGVVVSKQSIAAQNEKINNLLNSVTPLLRDEVITESVYALNLRGHNFWEKYSAEGLEVGIYRPDGSQMFETNGSRILREILLGKLNSNYVFAKKDIYFANELAGQVVLAQKIDATKQRNFQRHILITLAVLLFAFLLLFFLIRHSMNMWVIDPARKLTASIPRIKKYLEDQLNEPGIPNNFGTREMDEIAQVLSNVIVKYRDAHKIKMQYELLTVSQESTIQIAAQVAHDIRSPLAALTAATQDMSQLPEDKRIMIRSAVQRIGDIANDLAGRGKQKQIEEGSHQENKITVQLLSGIIDSLISEKRLQFRARLGVKIQSNLDDESYGLFAKVEPVQFKRVLSNLVNNAVEAILDNGTVIITVKQNKDDKIVISVSDTGSGIPPEILSKLMQRGATFGKKEGQGLGLFHARESVESWGGEIEITSEIGKGTTVTVTLPFEREPAWFVPELVVYPGSHIVILDDDESIHQIWKGRFETNESGVILHHFSNGNALRNGLSHININGPMLILCDYEILGNEETGLDVIKSLGLAEHTVLVTSRFEEKLVRESCEKMAIKLLPKNLAGFVPIRQITIPLDLEFVLIDDSRMNRTTWEIMARAKKRKIITFERPKDFYDMAERINKDAKLYVDLNLGAGISGKDVTREISRKGFENIFLYTGEDHVDIKDMPWIKGVTGKNLPFSTRPKS